MADLAQPLVIDSGTGSIRVGFSGEDRPKLALPTAVGRPKHTRVMAGGALQGSTFVGPALAEHRGALKLSPAMEHGHVMSWSDLELLWRYAYSGLGAAPESAPLLLTEAPGTPRAQRERAAEILFEALHVPGLCMSPTPVLALYGSGRTTGAVVEVGEGVTSVTPVYEGFALTHAAVRAEYGGREVTDQLALLLRRAGGSLHTSAERETVRAVKESACYVAPLPSVEEGSVLHRTYASVSYALPDGSKLELGPERFRASEVLFKPSLAGLEYGGVPELLAAAIGRSDLDLRRSLLGSVVLSGGATCTRGFGARLLADVRRLSPSDARIRVFAAPERPLLPWIGGSILASLSTFRKLCCTKEAWMEEGPNALLRS
jgi:centractin